MLLGQLGMLPGIGMLLGLPGAGICPRLPSIGMLLGTGMLPKPAWPLGLLRVRDLLPHSFIEHTSRHLIKTSQEAGCFAFTGSAIWRRETIIWATFIVSVFVGIVMEKRFISYQILINI